MSRIDDDFAAQFRLLILDAFQELPPAHVVHGIAGRAPDAEWLGNFIDRVFADRHPVSDALDQYTSAHWQIGQYDGIVSGLNRAAEVLRTRAGQHYAGNKDDLASALRNAAELVDKEALEAATDATMAKKARGYGP